MKTPDRDARRNDPLAGDEPPDALDLLIAEVRVAVDPGFSRQVMSRLPEASALGRRAARREWTIAGALAAVLVVLSAIVLAGAEGTEIGVATSIVDLVVATLAAGAGFLTASWRGLGEAVGAALDGSATAIFALGLAALAANGLLFLLRRRRRGAAARSRDQS
jgi:hypothetical protein